MCVCISVHTLLKVAWSGGRNEQIYYHKSYHRLNYFLLIFFHLHTFYIMLDLRVLCWVLGIRNVTGTSLVVQWIRICLPMKETCVQSLVQEDYTCHGATRPMCHNYWAQALEPENCNYRACMARACALQQEKPLQWEACTPPTKSRPCSPQLKKAHTQQWRPSTTKN